MSLGDYDVLAVDETNWKIWIIESKVLGKVGSFFEFYTQQRRFFEDHKEDEHFQLRIDFLKNNIDRVVEYLNLKPEKYEVVPFMVVNKVMDARFKKIGFDIIGYSELKEKIQGVS